jgi:hypothetical protein
MGPLVDAIREAGADLHDLRIQDRDGGTRVVTVDVRIRDPSDLEDVVNALSALPEVEHCGVRKTPDYRP